MSQETGLFSVRRPRETLGPLNHNVSAIPMPTSAMKRSNSNSGYQQQAPFTANHASSRMSLAPGRPAQPVFARSSSGTNLAEMPFSTVQRNSTVNMFSSTGGRKSYAPVSATPAPALQLSQQSIQRRSSVYSARQSVSAGQLGTQSFFATAPVPAGVPRDPRPLKDRAYQAQMGQELLDYMVQKNFELEMKHTLTQKTMTSPTQKDFNYMFQWLYNRLDPAYRFLKGIDAEVPPILKQLRYPFEKSITKSQLSAVGGQNWSTFLGMLHWLMQLAKQMEQYAVGEYDDACMEAGFEVRQDHIRFEFISNAYRTWLSMEEDQDDQVEELLKPHVDEMVRKLDDANKVYLQQVQELEEEQRKLQDQIDELSKSGSKIAKLDEEIEILEGDRVRFENYNNTVEAKAERHEKRAQLMEESLQALEGDLREVEHERATLQEAVDRQGIPMQEIDRMNSERERLQTGLGTTKQRLDESRLKVAERETLASQKLETLEGTVRDFNTLGYNIGIIPSSAALADGQDFELRLLVNEAPDFHTSRTKRSESPDSDRLLADPNTGYQPQHLLNLDIKGHVKNSIISLRKTISERKNAAVEDDIKKKDILDNIRDAMEEKEQEVEGIKHKLRAAEEEFEDTKALTNNQRIAAEAQIEKLEKQLREARTSMTESVELWKQREEIVNLEYEELKDRASALQQELHGEVERMLEDVIKFKLHIQNSLEEYEQFVADEVEQEVEEQELADAGTVAEE